MWRPHRPLSWGKKEKQLQRLLHGLLSGALEDTAGPGGRGLGEGWDMTRLARGRHLAPGTDPAQVHCVVHSPRTCGGHGECGGLW